METIISPTRPVPVHPGLPFIGNTLEYVRGPLPFLNRLQEQYGQSRAVRIALGGLTTILLLKPEETRYVLQENNRNYGRGRSFAVLRQFLGNGLLTSEGDFWRRQRRLAQPAFHKQKLAILAETMIDEAVAWADRLQQADHKGPVNVTSATIDATLRIVSRTLFGSVLTDGVDNLSNALASLNHLANNTLINPIRLPKWIPTPNQRAFRRATETVDRLIHQIIQTRRASAESHDDLLDMLLRAEDEETSERMSDQQLRDEVVTLFIAGHETTATSLAWTLHLLANHPDVQARAKAEVETVLAERDRPSPEDLRSLTYLMQIIQESLRMYPPAWAMTRLSLGPDQLGDYAIKAGDGILLSPYVLHHDPASWPEPEQFNPDRFLPERVKERHPYAFLPFGGGPRLCIGNQFALMEMQVMLAVLLQRFIIKPTGQPIDAQPLITLRSKQAVTVFLS
ncbi:cyc2 [Fibrisoma limi BUZ 3]|uniref:Cyc2 protein n=1 Tax=Fibrisoma limi BUZ 3 TaxID=1185876 RepID=I2GP41_9BACT|nr:cytochrome P450 [Fibrisoma limi]CCH55669.1 cyc2 [Fibrisoma limi BUZ 3]